MLEKRQASLMADNEDTKMEIIETLRENEQMVETMDTLLNIAKMSQGSVCSEGGGTTQMQQLCDSDNTMDELCAGMTEKCKLSGESKASFIEKLLSPARDLVQKIKRKKENDGIKEDGNTDYTDADADVDYSDLE